MASRAAACGSVPTQAPQTLRTTRAGSRPSEAWLLRRYRRHGDAAARDELVRRLMPLVRGIARSYGDRGRHDDLEQVAALGLVKAINRYDPTLGHSLRSYAVPTMTGEVRRYLRDHSWMVRPPRKLQERVLAVTSATRRLTAATGRPPTPQQIAAELGCDAEQIHEAMQAAQAYAGLSLDAPASGDDDDERGLADTLGAEDERLSRVEHAVTLRSLREVLDEQERRLLHLRFVEDRTQVEIAGVIGVSQMQVSRLLRRSLGRLAETVTQPA
jgi:RNA polymerase sigma-B factor